MNTSSSFKIMKNSTAFQKELHIKCEDVWEDVKLNLGTSQVDIDPRSQKLTSTLASPMPEPLPVYKKKWRTALKWEDKVCSRFFTRERKATEKTYVNIHARGTDSDHAIDEQARRSPDAGKWAKASVKERVHLEKYVVFTKVTKLCEGAKPINTKCVYVIS